MDMIQNDHGRFDIPADMLGLLKVQADEGQPEALFRAFDELCRERCGHRLFTLLSFNRELNLTQRVYSNRPVEYPVGRKKPMGPTAWGKHVLHGGQSWFGETPDDLRWAFPDHELIASLGCETCLNAPVRWNGEVIGAVSFLDVAGAYSRADLAGLDVLAQLLAAPFLSLRIDASDVNPEG